MNDYELDDILEENLNDSLTHQVLDDGPVTLWWALRSMVGYERSDDPSTGETYAELHVREAVTQLKYALLALQNR